MRKSRIYLLVLVIGILSLVSCELTEEILVDFNIMQTAGYSKAIFEDNKMKDGASTLNFLVSIRNQTDQDAAVTGWTFRIMHNIVPLCEISSTNFETFKVEVNSAGTIPASQILDFYVNTRQPYRDHLVANSRLGFEDYLPTTLVVELEITDGEGNIHTISAKGNYVYETEIDDDN